MIISQMIAWAGGAEGEDTDEGYVATIQTKSCLVFQLKREEKSTGRSVVGSVNRRYYVGLGRDRPASRSNLICAYSSFLDE